MDIDWISILVIYIISLGDKIKHNFQHKNGISGILVHRRSKKALLTDNAFEGLVFERSYGSTCEVYRGFLKLGDSRENSILMSGSCDIPRM